jgi:hypothetical protein
MAPMADSIKPSTRRSPINRLVRRIRRVGGLVFDQVVWRIDRLFDYRHGTDTSGIINVNDLRVSNANIRHAQPYEPTPTNVFKRALSSLPIKHEEYIFIDCGSGKGRTLLLASHFPFSKIVGIEFCEDLHHTAARNLAKYKGQGRRCSAIESICIDASEYEFPDANLVVFFFNPFDEAIIASVLMHLKKVSDRRKVYLIYCEAKFSNVIDTMGAFPHRKHIALPRWVMRRPGALKSLIMYSNQSLPPA